jgi:hypothetical protein
MNTIKSTAADFCNGSLESDQAELLSAIESDKRNYGHDVHLNHMIAKLVTEALNAQTLTVCPEDDDAIITPAEFTQYYCDMAKDLLSA